MQRRHQTSGDRTENNLYPERNRVQAKKSLGQHFLRSSVALKKIVDAAKLVPGERVLEIGPGEGALTEKLLESGVRVVAVETDTRCISHLKERFAQHIMNGEVKLLEGDIRSTEIQQLLFADRYLGDNDYKVVANIPYYITGLLLRIFLESLRQPTQMVYLIQHEVAKLIVAKGGKEGVLSLAVKAFGTPHYVAKVKREAFSPPPKVDSAILSIENINSDRFTSIDKKLFFEVLHMGLSAKRKLLAGNIAKGMGIQKNTVEELLARLSLSLKTRGEDLPIDGWFCLVKELQSLQ